MADWNKPGLGDLYQDYLDLLKARDVDLAKMFDGQTVTNPFSGMIRWSSANNRLEKYNGSAWGVLSAAYAMALGAGSSVDAAPIGATTASTGKFTTLESSGLTKLATASRLLVAGATDDGATALQVNGAITFTTQATADNSTKGATTAYVKAQGYATLASPALTGTPTVPTAAADTNTTQAASTAWVLGQAASVAPLMAGTAAVGTSTRWARQDHVHPTDTTRAPLASPALTGTPTVPTAAAGTNTTQAASCAFVIGNVPTLLGTKVNSSTNGTVTVNQPNGATYIGGSTVTGALKIALPVGSWTYNTMMRMRVEVWDYALGESFTLDIAGYLTSTHTWSNQTVTILAGRADRDFTVRFGNDGVTGCIWIGELASTWSYPRVYVSEVMTTYNSDGNSIDRWANGWAITAATAFDTVEDTISGNLPVAKTAAALTTARTITLTGDATGSVSFDGSANVSITTSVAALAGKAPLASPALTGTPTVPTAAVDTNTTQAASCAFVIGQSYAKLASPALTGVPTAPTAALGTNTTQLSTCEFVQNAITASVSPPVVAFREIFTASGTWTCPAGVTKVHAVVVGGGGGGAAQYSTSGAGGDGGWGGVGWGVIDVVPGTEYTVTVGAGGAAAGSTGYNSGYGVAGGSSSFGTITATGGSGGSYGSGSAGTTAASGSASGTGLVAAFTAAAGHCPAPLNGLTTRPWSSTTGNTSFSGIAFSVGAKYAAGAQGLGEDGAGPYDPTPGTGGAVMIWAG